MGHKQSHKGQYAGSNNGYWKPHKATVFKGNHETILFYINKFQPFYSQIIQQWEVRRAKTWRINYKNVWKKLKTYCGKCNKGKDFWGWHEEKNHDDNFVPKPRDNARKHENSRTQKLQLDDDMKKALNKLTGGMGKATDASKPDF